MRLNCDPPGQMIVLVYRLLQDRINGVPRKGQEDIGFKRYLRSSLRFKSEPLLGTGKGNPRVADLCTHDPSCTLASAKGPQVP